MSASIGCGCGHKLDFCHKVNASRWCGAETPNEVYREHLFRIAEEAGADVSGGVPMWPPIEAWALQAVQQLRRDYDEAIGSPPASESSSSDASGVSDG